MESLVEVRSAPPAHCSEDVARAVRGTGAKSPEPAAVCTAVQQFLSIPIPSPVRWSHQSGLHSVARLQPCPRCHWSWPASEHREIGWKKGRGWHLVGGGMGGGLRLECDLSFFFFSFFSFENCACWSLTLLLLLLLIFIREVLSLLNSHDLQAVSAGYLLVHVSWKEAVTVSQSRA